jgi:hypothetical protein
LNPLIYPEWWGDDNQDLEEDDSVFQPSSKRPHSGNNRVIEVHHHDGWRKHIAREEDSSLDRRLMEAKEEAARLERMFAENKRDNHSKNRGVVKYAPQYYE